MQAGRGFTNDKELEFFLFFSLACDWAKIIVLFGVWVFTKEAIREVIVVCSVNGICCLVLSDGILIVAPGMG